MSKVPPLRAFKKPNTFGAIPKNEHKDDKVNSTNLGLTKNEISSLSRPWQDDAFDTFEPDPAEVLRNEVIGTIEVRDKCEITTREELGKYETTMREVRDQSKPLMTESKDKVRDKCEISAREVPDKVRDKVRDKKPKFSPISDFDFACPLPLETIRLKQKTVLDFLFKKALDDGGKDNRIAQGITKDQLAKITQSKPLAAKDVARQLLEKDAIRIYNVVDGRGGWVDYIIAKNFHSELYIQQINGIQKVRDKYEKSAREVPDKVRDKVRENVPSSSLKEERDPKTTTTRKPELPDDWKEIDCAPLREQAEGFGEDHLRRLLKLGTTTPIQVQENIKRIAFSVKHKTQTFKKTPIAMLMGLCSEGKYFDAPKGYYPIVQSEQAASTKSEEEPESTQEEKAAAEEAKTMIKNLGKSLFGEMPKS